MTLLAPWVFAITQTANGVPTSIGVAQKAIIEHWLGDHPKWRLADERDCPKSKKQIRTIREGKDPDFTGSFPDFQPYCLSADFNGDGIDDLAIVVRSKFKFSADESSEPLEEGPIEGATVKSIEQQRYRFRLIVFNGPLAVDGIQSPTFKSNYTDDFSNSYFWYGVSGPNGPTLHLGANLTGHRELKWINGKYQF